MPSLSDRLKSLGVKVGTAGLPPAEPRPGTGVPIQSVLDGRFQSTRLGETFVFEQTYPAGYRHGRALLGLAPHLDALAAWAQDPRLLELPRQAYAFLDTETSGLAGGTGTYTFLVGVGRYTAEGFHLAQFFMRDPAEEPAQLAALTEFCQPCRGLVTFNGKAFDAPLLNTRYVTNGEIFPLGSAAHLDLLPLARRLWRDRLPSRALGYLEMAILGITRTGEDVPGWLIPSIYFDYLRSGDARPLKSVFYHNALDVLSLAALLSHVAQLLDDPLHAAVEHGLDLIALGKLFEEMEQVETAIQLYERGLERELSEEAYWEATQRLSFVHKRRDNLAAAVECWREAADGGQIYAHIELAKFYEHRLRDYEAAAQWTRAALERVNAPEFPLQARREWLADLEHRLARLRRKLGDDL